MPLEGLQEEGLPCNPDLSLAQKKFLLTVTDNAEEKERLAAEILTVIKEKGIFIAVVYVLAVLMRSRGSFLRWISAMAPFYASLCQELHLELDRALLEELQKMNKAKLEVGCSK